MDWLTDNAILDTDSIEMQEDAKQYYLVETFKQEQVVGTIQEEKIGSLKFIRVDVPTRCGYSPQYTKYLAINTVASMTPINKATAIKFVKNSLLTQAPINKEFSFGTDNNSAIIDNWALPNISDISHNKAEANKLSCCRSIIHSKGIKQRLLGTALLGSAVCSVSISQPTVSIEVSFWLSLVPIAVLLILIVIEHFSEVDS